MASGARSDWTWATKPSRGRGARRAGSLREPEPVLPVNPAPPSAPYSSDAAGRASITRPCNARVGRSPRERRPNNSPRRPVPPTRHCRRTTIRIAPTSAGLPCRRQGRLPGFSTAFLRRLAMEPSAAGSAAAYEAGVGGLFLPISVFGSAGCPAAGICLRLGARLPRPVCQPRLDLAVQSRGRDRLRVGSAAFSPQSRPAFERRLERLDRLCLPKQAPGLCASGPAAVQPAPLSSPFSSAGRSRKSA